jgi:hypothetical protein
MSASLNAPGSDPGTYSASSSANVEPAANEPSPAPRNTNDSPILSTAVLAGGNEIELAVGIEISDGQTLRLERAEVDARPRVARRTGDEELAILRKEVDLPVAVEIARGPQLVGRGVGELRARRHASAPVDVRSEESVLVGVSGDDLGIAVTVDVGDGDELSFDLIRAGHDGAVFLPVIDGNPASTSPRTLNGNE